MKTRFLWGGLVVAMTLALLAIIGNSREQTLLLGEDKTSIYIIGNTCMINASPSRSIIQMSTEFEECLQVHKHHTNKKLP